MFRRPGSPRTTCVHRALKRHHGIGLIFATASFVVPTTSAAWTTPVQKPEPTTLVNLNGRYPVGTPDASEPSGEAPPNSKALVGYRLSYVADFSGTTVPKGWDVFTGIPGGDPGGHFGISHVVVDDGTLQLLTYRDPNYHDGWVTGGLCQCSVAHIYGAYFVRSRVTGKGPNEVELLWPVTNQWPPEIDFNETGGSIVSSSSSLHYGTSNIVVRHHVNINMTQWHTWGVIWMPNEVIYTVDGRIWGVDQGSATIPKVPMTLDLEQRTICSENRQCPSSPVTMYVDWVAEYVKS